MTVAVAGVVRVAGAEYSPVVLTVPGPGVLQVAAVLVVPLTVAVSCCVAPSMTVGVLGATFTVTTGAVIVTVAVSDLVVSSMEVAVMVMVAGLGTVSGAV